MKTLVWFEFELVVPGFCLRRADQAQPSGLSHTRR